MTPIATARPTRADIILVGGGLANLMIAWRLTQARPELRIIIVERGDSLGGNHTWSFHGSDISAAQHAWLAPLVSHNWPRQETRFPGRARVLETPYHSLVSEHVHAKVMERLGANVYLGASVVAIEADRVTLADQTVLSAPLVIDGRGALDDPALALGFQKFVGLEVELEAPHGQAHPIIMDATVPQDDGYRFVYTLPFSPTRILIEDTYYSDGSELAGEHLDDQVLAYAAQRGWRIANIVRREKGILPIALAGDIDAHWRRLGSTIPRVGLGAWLFHPTTGYSLPYAVRVADLIAGERDLTSDAIARAIETHARDVWAEQAFFRLLNRMLFVAAEPAQRVRVLARFYRLGHGMIERFYAGRLTKADAVRILTGWPPVPIHRALGAIPESAAWAKVGGKADRDGTVTAGRP